MVLTSLWANILLSGYGQGNVSGGGLRPIDGILHFWGDSEMVSLRGPAFEFFEDGVDF